MAIRLIVIASVSPRPLNVIVPETRAPASLTILYRLVRKWAAARQSPSGEVTAREPAAAQPAPPDDRLAIRCNVRFRVGALFPCCDPAALLGRSYIPRPRARSTLVSSLDRKSTRLNSSHVAISYAVFCLKKKKKKYNILIIAITLQKQTT